MHGPSDSSPQKLPLGNFEKEGKKEREREKEIDLPQIVLRRCLTRYIGYFLVELTAIPTFLCSPQHCRRLETLQYFPDSLARWVLASSWRQRAQYWGRPSASGSSGLCGRGRWWGVGSHRLQHSRHGMAERRWWSQSSRDLEPIPGLPQMQCC